MMMREFASRLTQGQAVKAMLLAIVVVGLATVARSIPQESAPAPDLADEGSLIQVDVAVVNVLCTVRDRKGQLVDHLDKASFEIRENGKVQPIVNFSKDNNLPLTVGVLFDSSVSQERVLPAERTAADLFFRTFLQPNDAAFLIRFDSQVELLQDVTGSVEHLRDGLSGIRTRAPVTAPTGPFPGGGFGGGTHLHDAVFLAAEDILKNEAGRKALILITDGQDQGSKVTLDRAIEAAQRVDAMLYSILFYDSAAYGSVYGPAGYSGTAVLTKMAQQTGGRMFRADNDQELRLAFDEISRELRTLYSLGYSPTNSTQDGTYRKIDVRVKAGGMRVQARKGYYAPRAALPADKPANMPNDQQKRR
jgi:VWFA-related protein